MLVGVSSAKFRKYILISRKIYSEDVALVKQVWKFIRAHDLRYQGITHQRRKMQTTEVKINRDLFSRGL